MPPLGDDHRAAIRTLATELEGAGVTWALTGSASFALQGVPVEPDDVDVQTTAEGASEIERRFAERVVEPVSFSAAERIRSHFGAFEVEGVRVEVMGAVQKRRADGRWESPVDVAAHRREVSLDGVCVPVLSLAYEARAYERLGRTERAALLREHVE
ncbi:nucleotidyltransferase domain-containing protein [Salinilacihabitans rarus]|uniref:nucleotidyltransferase domain-containing protein n=1 Tax=Salinilacihabitans rarus TaxID=2961596 RepID=UPI0020C88DC1|nr:hypothetical protein [Salinilacihabitans rarus]